MDSEIKVYTDTFKKDISLLIYVKIRYENFHCSLIVDKRTAFCLKHYGSFKGSSTCGVCYVPSDLKKDGKVRKLERFIPVWVLMFRPLTFWTRTFRPLIIVLLQKIYVSVAISVI